MHVERRTSALRARRELVVLDLDELARGSAPVRRLIALVRFDDLPLDGSPG